MCICLPVCVRECECDVCVCVCVCVWFTDPVTSLQSPRIETTLLLVLARAPFRAPVAAGFAYTQTERDKEGHGECARRERSIREGKRE